MSGLVTRHCPTCGAYVTPGGHDEDACERKHRLERYKRGRALAQAELDAAAAERATTDPEHDDANLTASPAVDEPHEKGDRS